MKRTMKKLLFFLAAGLLAVSCIININGGVFVGSCVAAWLRGCVDARRYITKGLSPCDIALSFHQDCYVFERLFLGELKHLYYLCNI